MKEKEVKNQVDIIKNINMELFQNTKLDTFLQNILDEIKKTNRKNIFCKNKVGIGANLVINFLEKKLGNKVNTYKSFAPTNSKQSLLRQAFNCVKDKNINAPNEFNIIKEFDYLEIKKFLKTLTSKEKENLILLVVESGVKEKLDKRFSEEKGFKFINYLKLKRETVCVYIKIIEE